MEIITSEHTMISRLPNRIQKKIISILPEIKVVTTIPRSDERKIKDPIIICDTDTINMILLPSKGEHFVIKYTDKCGYLTDDTNMQIYFHDKKDDKIKMIDVDEPYYIDSESIYNDNDSNMLTMVKQVMTTLELPDSFNVIIRA